MSSKYDDYLVPFVRFVTRYAEVIFSILSISMSKRQIKDKLMPQNESTNDRLFRIVLFMFLVTLAIAWESWILLALSAIPLVTGILGFCPLYAITGYQSLEETNS